MKLRGNSERMMDKRFMLSRTYSIHTY